MLCVPNAFSSTMPRRETASLSREAALSLLVLLTLEARAAASSFIVEKAAFSIIEPESLKGSFDSAIGDFGGVIWPELERPAGIAPNAEPRARYRHRPSRTPCTSALPFPYPFMISGLLIFEYFFGFRFNFPESANENNRLVPLRSLTAVPRYGAKLIGEVVHDAMNALGCELFFNLPKATGVGHSTVVLVDRGDCFFVEKAWHAQLAGANAILVADNVDEELLTMANPEGQGGEQAELAEKVTIPSALVSKSVGEKLKQSIQDGARPVVALDWSDSIANPDERVEWELWHSSNQVCGRVCERVAGFVNEMHGAAVTLEKAGDASFSPHFITLSCPQGSPICGELCIYSGRYCAPDPTEGTGVDAAVAAGVRTHGYNGSSVVTENLRQVCLFRELAGPHHSAPWLWWDYAMRHRDQCKMTEGNFDERCADTVMTGLGLDAESLGRVKTCVGDTSSNTVNEAMEEELSLQSDKDSSGRGAIVLLPTVVINLDQYRGRLTGKDALRAICAGFMESTEPPACLAAAMENNECEQEGNAGCWKGPPGYNFSACVDTFRGYKCVCPSGFSGDGVMCEDIDECAPHDPQMHSCEQRCTNTVGGHRCECDDGFRLVGSTSCIMIDECVESGNNGGCQQGCVPRPGGFTCTCTIEGYQLAEDGRTCALTPQAQKAMEDSAKAAAGGSRGGGTSVGSVLGITFLVLSVAALTVFAAYRWKIKSQIDREVRAIMADYLPLDDERARGGGSDDFDERSMREVDDLGSSTPFPMTPFSSSSTKPNAAGDSKMIPIITTRQAGGEDAGEDDYSV